MKCTKSVNKRFLTTHSRNYLAVGVVVGVVASVSLQPRHRVEWEVGQAQGSPEIP